MGLYDDEIYAEYAVENEKLQKQIETLRTVLQPFAAYVDKPTKIYEHEGVRMVLVDPDVLMRLCRAAAAALKEAGDD